MPIRNSKGLSIQHERRDRTSIENAAFTLNVIIESDVEKRQRITLAYQETELLVATIPLDDGDARPRIEPASSALIDTKRLETLPAPDGC